MLDHSTGVCNAVQGIHFLYKLADLIWQSQTCSLMTLNKSVKVKVVQILSSTLFGSFE